MFRPRLIQTLTATSRRPADIILKRSNLISTRSDILLKRGVFGASRASKSLSNEPGSNQTPNQNNNLKPNSQKPEKQPVQEIDISAHPIIKRLPKFLHKYVINFANTPVSHVTSFIILHELTAIAPLFGIWGLFYYLDYAPTGLPEWLTSSGVDFIKMLAERNGWNLEYTGNGAKLILQGAAAYSVVKLLLPFRAAFSLFLMPWFARTVVIPFSRVFKVFVPKRFKKSKVAKEDDAKVWEQDLSDGISRKKIDTPKDPNRPQL